MDFVVLHLKYIDLETKPKMAIVVEYSKLVLKIVDPLFLEWDHGIVQ